MAVSKNKKAGSVNVKKCFTFNCDETLSVMRLQKYTEPKFNGMLFTCSKCGSFDKAGNKVKI